MPASSRKQRTPSLIWRAGGWMVIVAVAFAALGIFLAVRQAGRLNRLLTLQAQNRAVDIANKARSGLSAQLESLFAAIENRGLTSEHTAGRFAQDDLPYWVLDVYTWDGQQLRPLPDGSAPSEAQSRMVADQLRQREPENEPRSRRSLLIQGQDQGEPILLAADTAPLNETGGRTLVLRLDPNWLTTEVVEISPSDGLELARSGTPSDRPWVQGLFGSRRAGAASLWELRPTAAYVAEQTAAVRWQTWFHLALTVLALATLLTAMWILFRAARREVALADMKANFVADVSHELKTPLAVLRLYGETLQSGRISDEAKRQEYYAIITRESARLTNMINNILDFARIEAGRAEYRFRPTDVGAVVRETFDAYRPELERAGFEHSLHVDADLPYVNADRDAIVQILFNLMSNASKYSQDDKFVGVEVRRDTRRDKHGVDIAVHDHGIGISPEARAHLFEGFYRAPDERVRERSGAGLGLALVKHIVDAHQGTIDVESRLVRGSTFRIFLPAAEMIEKPRSAAGAVAVADLPAEEEAAVAASGIQDSVPRSG